MSGVSVGSGRRRNLTPFLFLKIIVIFIKILYPLSIRFANFELNAAKEKLKIVSGAAPPPFRIFAGGLPRRRRRRNAFGLIQEYCIRTSLQILCALLEFFYAVASSSEEYNSSLISVKLVEHFAIRCDDRRNARFVSSKNPYIRLGGAQTRHAKRTVKYKIA